MLRKRSPKSNHGSWDYKMVTKLATAWATENVVTSKNLVYLKAVGVTHSYDIN